MSRPHPGDTPPAGVPAVRPPRYTLRLAFGLQAAISAGDGLAMVALAIRVYQDSHASWAVAAVFLAITIPITALAPLAGLLLDRLPPRPVLIAAAAAEAGVALALTQVPGVGPVLALATGFGVCAAVLQPGLGAIVPQLVGPSGPSGQVAQDGRADRTRELDGTGQADRVDRADQTRQPDRADRVDQVDRIDQTDRVDRMDQTDRADRVDRTDQTDQSDRMDRADRMDQADRVDRSGRSGVTRANGYLQAATWGGFTIGPLLAGALTAAGGTGLALAGVAVIYALGALGLWALPLAPPDRTAGPGGPGATGHEGLAAQLGAGLRFLREDTDAGLLVLVVGLMVVFANMAVVAEVAFAESVLNAGPTGYSVLIAAWTAGMLVGTLAGGRLPERRLAVTALAGTLAAGAGVALAGAAAFLWQAAAAYAFGGLANGMEVVATRSFLNHRAPPQVAGRVFAVYSGVLFGAASVGMAAAGGLLGSVNPRLVLFLAGGGGLAAAGMGWFFYARRHARRAPSPQAGPPAATPAPAATTPPATTPAGGAPAAGAPTAGSPAAGSPDQQRLTPASRAQPPTAQPGRADPG